MQFFFGFVQLRAAFATVPRHFLQVATAMPDVWRACLARFSFQRLAALLATATSAKSFRLRAPLNLRLRPPRVRCPGLLGRNLSFKIARLLFQFGNGAAHGRKSFLRGRMVGAHFGNVAGNFFALASAFGDNALRLRNGFIQMTAPVSSKAVASALRGFAAAFASCESAFLAPSIWFCVGIRVASARGALRVRDAPLRAPDARCAVCAFVGFVLRLFARRFALFATACSGCLHLALRRFAKCSLTASMCCSPSSSSRLRAKSPDAFCLPCPPVIAPAGKTSSPSKSDQTRAAIAAFGKVNRYVQTVHNNHAAQQIVNGFVMLRVHMTLTRWPRRARRDAFRMLPRAIAESAGLQIGQRQKSGAAGLIVFEPCDSIFRFAVVRANQIMHARAERDFDGVFRFPAARARHRLTSV